MKFYSYFFLLLPFYSNSSIINRKMIEKQSPRRTHQIRYGISTVSSKQNKHTGSPNRNTNKSPVRIIKTQSIHLHQNQASNATIFPLRATSPNFYVASPSIVSHRAEINELAGRETRHIHKGVIHFEETRSVNHSQNDAIRKIFMLQARIKELHMEKQVTVVELNEKMNKLQLENNRLNAELQKYQTQSSLVKDKHKTQGNQFDQSSLQEMLSNQINLNLELREQNQKFIKENMTLSEKIAELDLKFKASEAQKNDLIRIHKEVLAVQKKQKQICLNLQKALEERLNKLEQLKNSRTMAIEALIQEKQKRILELQEEAYSKKSTTQLKQKEIRILEQDLSSERLDNAHLREQLQNLKTKITQIESQQCKKCKDLLHTVFRLNTQLNKK